MTQSDEFKREVEDNITQLGRDEELRWMTLSWVKAASRHKYTYNFSWMGRPVIQFPQDIVAVQELIWRVRPDLVIETGIAHGGSLIASASMLAMLDYCDAVEAGETLDPRAPRRRVVGIDVDIRAHNRMAIERHPMAHRIDMIEGSSIAPDVVARVHEIAKQYQTVFICLDSDHTGQHVLAELEAYAPLTGRGSYCCVFDTLIEDMPDEMFSERPWGRGNNPKTAVWEYLRVLRKDGRTGSDGSPLAFQIDKTIEDKLLITVAPDGYLRRV